MYKSPIEIIQGQIHTQLEGHVLKAVQEYGINVDKDELIRALKYDREQYNKGYDDAMASIVRCKDCKYRIKSRWHAGYQCGNECDGMSSGVELRDDDFCSYGERNAE